MRRLVWCSAVLLGAVVAGGCVAPARGSPVLGVSNGTTMDLKIVAGGWLLAEVPAGGGTTIPLARLPSLPLDVEARTSTGRVVTSLHVEEDSAQFGTDADGVVLSNGAFARVDLSCGRLDLWFGVDRPMGPMPDLDAGRPGDCEP